MKTVKLGAAAAFAVLYVSSSAFLPGHAADEHADGAFDNATDSARGAGGRFEYRRKLSSIDNPYCAITTYVLSDFPAQASSAEDESDRAVIFIDAVTLRTDKAYGHFLLAHECCHHTLGHVRLTSNRLGQLGPQPIYYLRPLLKNMELDADRCAVKMLKLTKEPEAIEAGRQRMLSFGNAQTGAYYPTGVERYDNITRAAAED